MIGEKPVKSFEIRFMVSSVVDGDLEQHCRLR